MELKRAIEHALANRLEVASNPGPGSAVEVTLTILPGFERDLLDALRTGQPAAQVLRDALLDCGYGDA